MNPELIPTPLVGEREQKPVLIVEPRNPRWRTLRIVFAVGGWLLAIFWMWVTGRWTRQRNAERTREMLESLGFLWIKVGQILALRSDFFSNEFCAEMSRLQYAAHGFPPEISRAIIERELKHSIDIIFTEFRDLPIAAASIAQVHSARLIRTGTPVVIKVMRPGAERVFKADLKVLRRVVVWLETLKIFSFLRWSEALWEVEQIMAEELDYRFELSNLRRMRKHLRRHKVYVPKAFGRYCTRHVLVMERIEGVLMVDYINLSNSQPDRVLDWLAENNIDPKLVGRRLYMSFMRQLFEEDLFHGDLHPGNIFLLRDSRFALIDLGTTGTVESNLLRKYIFITKAIATQQLDRAADLMLSLCPELPPVDLAQVKEEMVRSLRSWQIRTPVKTLPYYEKSLTYGITDLVTILAENKIAVTWGFMKIDRTWATMDASMNYLMPEVDYPVLIRRYFVRRGRRIVRETLTLQSLWRSIVEVRDAFSEYSLFIDPQVRALGMVLEGASSSAAHGMVAILQIVTTGLFLGGLYLLAAFLHQHAHFLTGTTFAFLQPYLDRMPAWSTGLWASVIVADFYIWYKVRKTRQELDRGEMRLPGNIRVAPKQRRIRGKGR